MNPKDLLYRRLDPLAFDVREATVLGFTVVGVVIRVRDNKPFRVELDLTTNELSMKPLPEDLVGRLLKTPAKH